MKKKHKRFRKHLERKNPIAYQRTGWEEMQAITNALSLDDIAF